MNTENKKLGKGLEALLPSGKNKEDKSYADTIIKKVSSIENMVDEFSKFARLLNEQLLDGLPAVQSFWRSQNRDSEPTP